MKKHLITQSIFPLLDYINGTRISRHTNFLRESQWWSFDKLQAYQNEKLKVLVETACRQVPFYRKLFADYGLTANDIQTVADLKKLPVLTKQTIQENLSTLINPQYPKNDLFVNTTSGSTGPPALFYLTTEQDSWRWATRYRFWEWAGYSIGDPFINVTWHPPDSIKKRIYNFLFRRTLAFFYNTERSFTGQIENDIFENFIKLLQQQKSDFLLSYPSATYLAAQYIKRENIKGIRLKAILTQSESLLPHHRKFIEEVFQCPVFDYYGMGGEGFHIAGECEARQGYHIAMEDVVVEFLKDGQPAAEGEMAHVVTTPLHNSGFPMLRYDTGDLASFTNRKCKCGRELPLIDTICGRQSDVVVTPNGHFLSTLYFSELLENVPGVEDFQMVQKEPEAIKVILVENSKYTPKQAEQIKQAIQQTTENDLLITIEYTDSIPLTKAGKKRRVISDVGL